ncbi:MAG TPA: ABC transporter permease [Terracidiphilus sp.]|nr:ABC transporter permease [Terracidiphilus sp.]
MIQYCRALFRNLRHRQALNEELDEELSAYVESVVKDKVCRGISPEEAIREARLEIGGLEQVKQGVRDARKGAFVEGLMQDLRYALRTLAGSFGFSSIIVLTLALGIGANSAIFTLFNGVLLKPLPYPDSTRLVMLWETLVRNGALDGVAPANYYDWHRETHSFEKMAAIDPYPDFILTGSGSAQRLAGAAVSQEFFSLLGVHMALGRDFLPEEDKPGSRQAVILSYSTWMRLFGGRTDVVGQSIRLNDASYSIVGVLPRNFYLVSKAADYQSRNRIDIWTPLALPSPPAAWQRGTHPLCVFARLKPGISLQQAQADLNVVAGNLQLLYPNDDKDRGIAATPLESHVVEGIRVALFTLLAAVVMVLLLACANIANLMLTRGAARQKEIAVRIALGAGRMRIARQLLTESLVLSLVGGSLGFAILLVSVPALVRHLPADVPRAADVSIDWRVVLFTSLLSILTGILFGLVPLYQARRVSANDSLKQGGGAVAADHSRVQNSLTVAQLAIAVILLAGAGLMTKSLWRLTEVSPGFRTDHILTARLSLPPQYANGFVFGTGKHPRISQFEDELLQRMRAVPGVQSAAFASYLPMSGVDNSWAFYIAGRAPNPPGVFDVTHYRPVSAGYFETMGIPVLRGRTFSESDTDGSPLEVVINETMARTWWGSQTPVGQHIRFGDQHWRTVIGVVGDVHHDSLADTPEPDMYVPYGQVPNVEARPVIVVRTAIEPDSVVSALRSAVSDVDPNVPIDQIESMKQLVYGSESESRFRTAFVLTFAFLALFVASIGLYGVMSYSVTQRTREFGIRIAIGATRGAVLRAVLARAAKFVCIGVCVGVAGALVLTRLIASLLFGVRPVDISIFVSVPVLLIAIAFIASYFPAKRASSVNPMDALRYE